MNRFFLICLLSSFSLSSKSQNQTEIKIALDVLVQLSFKAQERNDESAVLIYQNTFNCVKEDNPALHGDQTFKEIETYFKEVKEKNHLKIKPKCFSLTGAVQQFVNNNHPSGGMLAPDSGDNQNPIPGVTVIPTPGGGWSNNVVPKYFLAMFDNGKLDQSDIEWFKAFESISSPEETPTLNADQITILKTKHDLLNKVIFKDEETNSYNNIFGMKSDQIDQIQLNSVNYEILNRAVIFNETQEDLKEGMEKNDIKNYDRLYKSYQNIQDSYSVLKGNNGSIGPN